MKDEMLDKNLSEFDYSVFSKVKDSLLDEIMQKYDNRKLKSFKIYSQMIMEETMTDDELDYIAAAGNSDIDNKKIPKDLH